MDNLPVPYTMRLFSRRRILILVGLSSAALAIVIIIFALPNSPKIKISYSDEFKIAAKGTSNLFCTYKVNNLKSKNKETIVSFDIWLQTGDQKVIDKVISQIPSGAPLKQLQMNDPAVVQRGSMEIHLDNSNCQIKLNDKHLVIIYMGTPYAIICDDWDKRQLAIFSAIYQSFPIKEYAESFCSDTP